MAVQSGEPAIHWPGLFAREVGGVKRGCGLPIRWGAEERPTGTATRMQAVTTSRKIIAGRMQPMAGSHVFNPESR